MRRSLQIPQEAKKNSIAITHDLATPKIAIHIQKEESLVYGNMFIARFATSFEVMHAFQNLLRFFKKIKNKYWRS